MAAVAYGEYELEALPELEGELELEGESELELEFESPELFGWSDVAGAARRGFNWLKTENSPQRRMALNAAKSAIKGGSSLLGSRIGGDTGKTIGDVIG